MVAISLAGKGFGDVASKWMVPCSRGPPNPGPRRANHRSPVAAIIIIALAAAALLLSLAILHSDNTEINPKSIMVDIGCAVCMHGLSRWSVLFLDDASSYYSLHEQPLVPPDSKGHSHSGASK